jgi:hypothetical protein
MPTNGSSTPFRYTGACGVISSSAASTGCALAVSGLTGFLGLFRFFCGFFAATFGFSVALFALDSGFFLNLSNTVAHSTQSYVVIYNNLYSTTNNIPKTDITQHHTQKHTPKPNQFPPLQKTDPTATATTAPQNYSYFK